LVSRVILSRFTLDAGPDAKRLNILTRAEPGVLQLVNPRNAAKEDWFIEVRAQQFEQCWGQAENAVVPALAELDAHIDLSGPSPDSARSITDIMALHLIRSAAAQHLWDRGRDRIVPRRRAAMAEDRTLLGLARSSGKFPAAWSDEQIVDSITAGLEDPLRKGGEAFGETLVELYNSVRAHFAKMYLEIGEAVDTDFVLPDVPCVPYDAEHGAAGLLAGFGLLRSDAVVMPLGPRHLASLVTRAPDAPWSRLASDQVGSINDVLANVALREVYLRPGSGLEHQVREVWSRSSERWR
jgi:hypothetical protein